MVGHSSTSPRWSCVRRGSIMRSMVTIITSCHGGNHGTSLRTGIGSTPGTSAESVAWTSCLLRILRSTDILQRWCTEVKLHYFYKRMGLCPFLGLNLLFTSSNLSFHPNNNFCSRQHQFNLYIWEKMQFPEQRLWCRSSSTNQHQWLVLGRWWVLVKIYKLNGRKVDEVGKWQIFYWLRRNFI